MNDPIDRFISGAPDAYEGKHVVVLKNEVLVDVEILMNRTRKSRSDIVSLAVQKAIEANLIE